MANVWSKCRSVPWRPCVGSWGALHATVHSVAAAANPHCRQGEEAARVMSPAVQGTVLDTWADVEVTSDASAPTISPAATRVN